MKKNGFTLIEILAALALMGMLATILITVSMKKINETKEESKNTMISSLELAAKNYVINYKDELTDFNTNDYMYVTLKTLLEKELLTNSLIDQTTKNALSLSDTVYVTRMNNGNIDAKYDINQNKKSKIYLNGSYNQYVKQGSTYTEQGATATSNNGSDITSSITISGNVNTSVIGKYVITYSTSDNSITRNVIVYK